MEAGVVEEEAAEAAEETVAQAVDAAVDADVVSINHHRDRSPINTATHTEAVTITVGIATFPPQDTSGTPPLKIKWAAPHTIVRIDS